MYVQDSFLPDKVKRLQIPPNAAWTGRAWHTHTQQNWQLQERKR